MSGRDDFHDEFRDIVSFFTQGCQSSSLGRCSSVTRAHAPRMDSLHTLRVRGETHTLGQLLATVAAAQRPSDFATYLVPHPLSDELQFRIGADSAAAARAALVLACKEVEWHLSILLSDLGVAPSEQPQHTPAPCALLRAP